jgi:hypothetical protein
MLFLNRIADEIINNDNAERAHGIPFVDWAADGESIQHTPYPHNGCLTSVTSWRTSSFTRKGDRLRAMCTFIATAS